MIDFNLNIALSYLLLLVLGITACLGQEKPQQATEDHGKNNQTFTLPYLKELDADAQIGQYVVEIFEDSKGNLWFGTMAHGVARYDGENLIYFTTKDGLPSNTVVTFAEDSNGNMWLGTHSGLSKYDGHSFINFTKKDGLIHNRVSNILIDRQGIIWIGTWGGVSRFINGTFTHFPLPKPNLELLPYQTTMDWVTQIMEDHQGHIWFCRDGYGGCRYDGQSFTHFTIDDGLASNNVQAILQDQRGHIWFGSRVAEMDNPDPNGRSGAGGLSRYDGQIMVRFPEKAGLHHNDVYSIYEDKAGHLWIGANKHGVYQYDGREFTLFSHTDRADLMPHGFGVQSILEDQHGVLWLGLSGGLFRLEGKRIVNVIKDDF